MTDYGIVLVTVASPDQGKAIATTLIEAHLAACVTVIPVQSIYRWQGQIHNDAEWQLIIKTKLDKFDELSATIQEIHSYDVPEILALPIVAGSSTYLQWMGENLS